MSLVIIGPLVGSIPLNVLVSLHTSHSIGNSGVFLSYKLPSESQGISIWILLVLLGLLHDVWIVRIVPILISDVELIALIHTFWSRRLFEWNSLSKLMISSLIHALLVQILMLNVSWIMGIASFSQSLLLQLHLFHLLVGQLHNVIWSKCIGGWKLVIELHFINNFNQLFLNTY